MAAQNELEVYRQHVTAQQKYAYFLLAAVGACVGFALTQTKDAILDTTQLPLAMALFGWGLSFWCGCMHLKGLQTVLYANMALIRTQSGREPPVGHNQALISYSENIIREIAVAHGNRSAKASLWQFRFFVLGVAAYICWHILEMAWRVQALS